MERLQKLISAAGICSRRAAEQLILEGRVTLNGEVVTELGTKAGPDDLILVDGVPVRPLRRLKYVALNKPAGFVTTKSDTHGRSTVYELLFPEDQALHPVGRLDRDTTGLLLLTNDGDLTHRLTHPSFEVEKVYLIWTDPRPNRETLKQLRQGVELDDGPAVPVAAHIASPEHFELTVSEGRNREVRRIFEAVEHRVLLLRRIRLGTLEIGALKEGKARPLSPHEVRSLRQLVGLE